jgi:exodeoxyribonuclease VII large subunit
VTIINTSQTRSIYTVSEFTSKVKELLEKNFPFIWISGEISNFRVPSSGHYYFSLKDKGAQISAVMFKGQNRSLKFVPKDGQNIIGLGRISLYEPRGTYQVIFEYLEPEGVGALQLAYEQLKNRLSEEGLFHETNKKPLPALPTKISVVTSPSGAVIHDVIKITNRRFPNLPIQVVPARVQGDAASHEITRAIILINQMSQKKPDVIILARGGGSLEDLQAFNSEDVARAIFASEIPVVSAVGHETDFTISDFVADVRAGTPSAAAEIVVPLKEHLEQRCNDLSRKLLLGFQRNIEHHGSRINELTTRLKDPQRKIDDLRLRVDDFISRIVRGVDTRITTKQEKLSWQMNRLNFHNPLIQMENRHKQLKNVSNHLLTACKVLLGNKRHEFQTLFSKLDALNPTAVLERGYSIARTIPDKTIVKDAGMVASGEEIDLLLATGSLRVKVTDHII